MKPANEFAQLLNELSAHVLEPNGFARRSQSFHFRQEGNWALVNFQKSTKSNARTIYFTVNLGVVSSRLIRFFSSLQPHRIPTIWNCHWRMRLRSLTTERTNTWWIIDESTNLTDLFNQLDKSIRDQAIPLLHNNLSDEALRDLWLTGQSPSLTEFDRLMNLSVLLKALGPRELLDKTLVQLQRESAGKPVAVRVELHIARLEKAEHL